MATIQLKIDWAKTAIRNDQMFLYLEAIPANNVKLHQVEVTFAPDSAVLAQHQPAEVLRGVGNTHFVVLRAVSGSLRLAATDAGGELHEGSTQLLEEQIAALKNEASLSLPPPPHGGGGGPAAPVTVRMARTAAPPVRDEALTRAIQASSDGLSFARFNRFVELAFCDDPRNERERKVKDHLLTELAVGEKPGSFLRADSFDRLDAAAEIFVLANARLRPSHEFSLINVHQQHQDVDAYLEGDTVLPYLRLVYDRLGIRPPAALREGVIEERTAHCRDILERRRAEPLLIELIWSYWHEEAMQSQAMAAISQRFQNRRASGERDPLLQLEIDPLRPLNHLLWKFAQSEVDRLSVLRRAHEYEHEYGFPLHGKAVNQLRAADRRSKFLEAFHNLLYRCVQFYKEDDDTTHVADGFPVLNALKETHYVLAQGAHNQFGDLPPTARKEMLVEQWILGRPEMREFLGGRPMVAYPEAWMDRVDTVKTLKGWTDVSVVHFHDLGVFGEQLLLSIRWPALSVTDDPNVGKAWARDWRAQVQGYIHALRATLGVDLAADITSGRDESERYLPPSVHLRRRLKAQAVAR
jgi:hypothetical protein